MDYLLKSMLCLLALLLIHRLLLQREVLHRFNRFFLLGAVLGSFVIPLYTIEVPAEQSKPLVFEAISEEGTEASEFESFAAIENIESTESSPSLALLETEFSESPFPWKKVLWMAYCLISAIFLIRFLRNLGRLLGLIRSNPHVPYQGETLVLNPENQSPFSFLKYIFISRKSFEQAGISEAVFAHERCHVRERHSWDILFVEALMIPFWFHPGLYLARYAIQLNHEFIADQAALCTTSVKAYQEQLLSILLAKSSQAMVSSLNFSLTKKRMQMMNKKSGSPLKWLKLGALVPIIGALVYFFGTKVEVRPDEQVLSVSEKSTQENPQEVVETSIRLLSSSEVEVDGKVIPIQELTQWIDEIKASQPIVRFSANPGVEMGVLADVQDILNSKEIRQVVFDTSNQTNSDSELEKKREAFYRNAYILVEDENMQYSRKTYQELTSKEKLKLLDPLEPREPASPDPAIFEAWKDGKTYAIWIDGVVSPNEKLKDYVPTDFAGFFQSGVKQNARSARFPQPYQVHLYSESYYEENFGPESEIYQPRTNLDTITLTQRGVTWHKDIQNYPDPTTAYLQKNARYEKLRTSGSLYLHKSVEEKALLDDLYQELNSEYSQASDKRKRNLRQPIPPDSSIKRFGDPNQNSSEKSVTLAVKNNQHDQVVYSFANATVFKGMPMEEYLSLYGKIQTKVYENRFRAIPTPDEIEKLRMEFDLLNANYLKLSLEERRQVKRPQFPYAKLEKEGKVIYKKFEDLTEEEKKNLGC